MGITAKTKKTQKQALLSWLKRHRKGITTMEAFEHLRMTCVHKRIGELESDYERLTAPPWIRQRYPITRTPERTATGSTVTRYKLAR
jgi:hypothetical protein